MLSGIPSDLYGNHWNQDKPDGRQVCVHAFIGKLSDGTPLLPIRRFLGTIVDGMVALLPITPTLGLKSARMALRILLISTQSIKKPLSYVLICVRNLVLPRIPSFAIARATNSALPATTAMSCTGSRNTARAWIRFEQRSGDSLNFMNPNNRRRIPPIDSIVFNLVRIASGPMLRRCSRSLRPRVSKTPSSKLNNLAYYGGPSSCLLTVEGLFLFKLRYSTTPLLSFER